MVDILLKFRKLKLRTIPYFVDSLTGNNKELEKVFLPMHFWTTQASTFQFCFGSVYFSKVKAKLKRACPTVQEKHRTPLTVSSMTTDLTGLKTCQVLSKIKNKKIDNSIEFLIFSTYIIHVDNPMGVTPLTIRLKPSLCV